MSKAATKQYKLTAKQEKFAQLLFQGYTQIDAWKSAYDASNMEDKTVYEAASRLANDSKIAARVEELRDPVIAILQRNAVQFAQTIVETASAVDKGGPDHTNRLKASKTGLDYLGYEAPKKQVNVNVQMSQDELDQLLGRLD
jgi:hypothetical protein